MKQVTLPGGEPVPALGLGTWRMGEVAGERAREVRALKAGIDMGLTLIDTAEMYGEGGAEEVVGEAVAGIRDGLFIVSKVYPHNASRQGAIAACERSLKRLGTGCIDLYLLHWRGGYPLAETVEAFEQLKRDGKIRHWGVSNLDMADMVELRNLPDGGNCAANQLYYCLTERGIEWDLLPDCQRRGIAVMAYSPLGQGGLTDDRALKAVAARHDVTAAAVALAWAMRQDGVIAIPKTADIDHLKANARALDVVLDAADLNALDRAFPPPTGAGALAMT